MTRHSASPSGCLSPAIDCLSVSLTGISDYSPGPSVDNATLEDVLQAPVTSLMAYFGVESRHYAIDPRTGACWEPDLNTAGMSVRAAREALKRSGSHACEIDALICATSTPDDRLPPLTRAVQHGLGMADIQMFDLRGGCAVALQALVLAASLIESGRAQRVLVTLADTLSRHFLTPLLGLKDVKTEALINALTFADGAAAAVVECTSGHRGGMQLSHVAARSRFSDRKHGFAVTDQGRTVHDHRAIREVLPDVMDEAVNALIASSCGVQAIDHLFVPQVNRSMLGLVRSELHDRVYYVGHRIGNCPAPAVLRALALGCDEGILLPGRQTIGVIGIETTSWTYGTALLN